MTGRDLRQAEESGEVELGRDRWAGLDPVPVLLAGLWPTQWQHYDPCRLCQQRLGRPIDGGDPFPHLVEWQGRRFVWDGHTRIARALRDGLTEILARVLVV